MALKDKNEHQTDDNYLIDVSDVFTRGILRGMGIEHEMFGGYGKLQSCSAAQAVLWTHLRETDWYSQLSIDVGVHTYRFRRAEVNRDLRFGESTKGKCAWVSIEPQLFKTRHLRNLMSFYMMQR